MIEAIVNEPFQLYLLSWFIPFGQINIGDYIHFDVPLNTGFLIFFGDMEEVDEFWWDSNGFIVEVVFL